MWLFRCMVARCAAGPAVLGVRPRTDRHWPASSTSEVSVQILPGPFYDLKPSHFKIGLRVRGDVLPTSLKKSGVHHLLVHRCHQLAASSRISLHVLDQAKVQIVLSLSLSPCSQKFQCITSEKSAILRMKCSPRRASLKSNAQHIFEHETFCYYEALRTFRLAASHRKGSTHRHPSASGHPQIL
jgi:hypothetical protein